MCWNKIIKSFLKNLTFSNNAKRAQKALIDRGGLHWESWVKKSKSLKMIRMSHVQANQSSRNKKSRWKVTNLNILAEILFMVWIRLIRLKSKFPQVKVDRGQKLQTQDCTQAIYSWGGWLLTSLTISVLDLIQINPLRILSSLHIESG